MTPPTHPGLRDLVVVGRGGFGVVYRARQEGLDRDVAIKFLHARRDEQARARFAQECRVLGQLSGHPHIVEVHDGGLGENDQAFLLMPYYPAGSLAGRLSGTGPLPWAEVAAIGVRMSGRCRPRTTPGSCTATSSRPTSCSTSTAAPAWPTSGRPASPTPS